jgi:hypothetical protein
LIQNKNVTLVSASQGLSREWTYQEFWHPIVNQMEISGLVFDNNFSEAFISINHNRKEYISYSRRFPQNKKFLIRTEPISVYPKQYQKEIEDLYDFIITPGGSENLYKDFKHANYPYFYQNNPFKFSNAENNLSDLIQKRINENFYSSDKWHKREILCSIIASNKISPIKDSNYELRRLVYSKIKESKLSKYGQFWKFSFNERLISRVGLIKFSLEQRSFYNYFRLFKHFFLNLRSVSAVSNKHDILSQSKYHLIIENSNDFITEKVYDALIDGAIPIYVGASLLDTGLPTGSYIQINPQFKEIDGMLSKLPDLDPGINLKIISELFTSEDFEKYFEGNRIYAEIAKEIIHKLSIEV